MTEGYENWYAIRQDFVPRIILYINLFKFRLLIVSARVPNKRSQNYKDLMSIVFQDLGLWIIIISFMETEVS